MKDQLPETNSWEKANYLISSQVDLHSNSIPTYKCNGKGGGRKERWRPCYRDCRHKPRCTHSSDNVENMVKIRWANRWAGWTNFFLKGAQRLNWSELSFSPAAWGKVLFMPRTAEVCAWDTILVKKTLIINSSAQNISIVRFSKCLYYYWCFCAGAGEKQTHRMQQEPEAVYQSRRLLTTEHFRL